MSCQMTTDTEREDLKAFERRLTEVIGCLEPKTRRWRVLLVTVCMCTVIGAVQWVRDPTTSQVPFVHSLFNHLFFTFSCILLSFLFIIGIHRKVVTPQIVVSRVRQVLADFNMSCDDSGRLILKPNQKTS